MTYNMSHWMLNLYIHNRASDVLQSGCIVL